MLLALICFLLAVGAAAINLFWDGTIRVEWFLGFIALGLALQILAVGPAVPDWRRRRESR